MSLLRELMALLIIMTMIFGAYGLAYYTEHLI